MSRLASDSHSSASGPTAVLVHLSGPFRGRTQRLARDRIRIGSCPGVEIPIPELEDSCLLATLKRRGASYELEAASPAQIWVNGEPVEHLVLASGDVLEIGKGGPVLRFRLYRPGSRTYKSLPEAFSDCLECARHGSTSRGQAVGLLLRGMSRELSREIAPWTRLAILCLLLVVIGGTGALWHRNLNLERQIVAERERVENLVALLKRNERNSFTAKDFAAARAQLEARLAQTSERIRTLEERGSLREQVIKNASRSVVFIQGAYGFDESASGKPLRFLGLDASGQPLKGRQGAPAFTLEGSGPLVEFFYTGSAFVVNPEGHLVTNRHVASPWEFDPTAQEIARHGFTPVMRRFIGYLPGSGKPFEVSLLRSSKTADVALLGSRLPDKETIPGLRFANSPPQLGDEVIVLGYPAGIEALLARSDAGFARKLLSGGPLDFWAVARGLAEGGYIAPLATLGIVGQITSRSVVYDAETTHGGSGGPVLGLDGKVVAVNAEILPQFGGSNMGVPAARVLELLR